MQGEKDNKKENLAWTFESKFSPENKLEYVQEEVFAELW